MKPCVFIDTLALHQVNIHKTVVTIAKNIHEGVAMWAAIVGLWLLAALAGLLTRPLIPVDELRYAAVAWEMWARGDFLVPYLNGEPYSHKPPLFFWLIHAGWWLFGISEWVVRAIAPLLTLLTLLLATLLARQLWPHDAATARQVPAVVFSSVFLVAFFSWVQIDLLLVVCVLLGLLGVAIAAQKRRSGWLLTGVAIGLGLLAKGPVILLHLLPVVLLAPLWLPPTAQRGWRWYAASMASVTMGAAIALAWALPAAQAGGAAYREAIFWGQTAERMVDSFAHAHPFWWYLPWLLVLFAPWIWLPWLWRAARHAWQQPDYGMRFCLVWLLGVFILLSLVSGKQLKYLLPLWPAFALLVAHVLAHMPQRPAGQKPWLLAALLAGLGAIGMVAPFLLDKAPWLNEVHPLWGGLLVMLALLLLWLPPALPERMPLRMLALSVCVVCIGETGVLRIGAPAYDLKQVSRLLAQAQADDRPVAVLDRYHGQFGFYGRLTEPVIQLQRDQLRDWARQYPRGYLVVTDRKSTAAPLQARFAQAYQGGYLAILDAAVVAEHGLPRP
jgi:4-amino-4-deoxy-L-arabinose transferase-like glycosyltransferase